MLGNIKTFAIFPALNVARVRNSDEYYVSSEIPGVYVGNRNGRVKLQVAGFRIYGYDENGKNLGEIKLQKGVEITWTVVLANKKAAHQGFDGMYHNHKSVRNAGVLIITNYANNDYWYDDTSDSSVDAMVTIGDKNLENRGHDLDKLSNFLDSELEKKLCTPPGKDEDNYKDLRISILFCVQIPKDPATKFERNGQTYDYFMPSIFGDGGNASSGDLDTYLILTRGQYYFEKLCTDPFHQVKFFNKAALEWCVGDAFYPGIEMTYLAYEKDTFKDASNESEHDFRINSDVIQPGDINAYMALPWQANFNECVTNWWPAQRPDIVIPKEKYVSGN
ncbi:hypothetical protein RhiirA4_420348 [Rhizophagus irregularis]|uniref:Uncharacterized protein n=1 Tax=Rhizophagus irregularis TaxID=588596 RepID=A0A2I1GHF0_9GLOM|nr:hypothetical protein RhiirA4_420348 [Rhizophagus irregularis]